MRMSTRSFPSVILEKVRVIGASESNTYDLLDNGSLVMTKDAVEYVQEVLS